MIDSTAATLALRNRALGVSVATTGSTSLSATATGYARAAGSFLTDGFAPGMEITTASGFSVSANNVANVAGKVITAVTALAITCAGNSVDGAASGRILTAGLPFDRAWENIDFTPTAGRPYVEEDFVPATSELVAAPFSGGTVEERGLYILKFYGIAAVGVSALRKTSDAVKLLFSSGTSITAGANTVKVRGDVGPWVGQILQTAEPRPVVTLTIPYRAYSLNAIAA